MSHLEITEVVLVHCNLVNNSYQQNQESYIHLFQLYHLVTYRSFYKKINIFKYI